MITVFVICYLIVLLLVCRHYWRRLRTRNVRFSYRITDIWAATFALVPTLVLYGAVAHEPSLQLLFGLVACSQLAGVFVGRLDFLAKAPDVFAGKASAHSVLAGGIFGILFLPAFTLCFPFLLLGTVLLPLILVMWYISRPLENKPPPGAAVDERDS